MTLNLYKATSAQSATFYGNDYTTNIAYKPYYLFGYHDAVPKVNNFSVGPAVDDILNKNLYDLTTENLNAIKFNFDVDGLSVYVPGSGILFEEGVYVDLTATPGVTILYT